MSKGSLLKHTLVPSSATTINNNQKYNEKSNRLVCTCLIALLVGTIYIVFPSWWWGPKDMMRHSSNNVRVSLDLSEMPQRLIQDDAELALAKNGNCSFWDCFNVYRCGQRDQTRIAIYVYPLETYTDSKGTSAFQMSKEFYYILKTIIESPYYTPNPQEACILVPSIDMLNQNRIDVNLVSKALASLT